MLQNDTSSLRQKFCKCQHADKAAVDKVREDTILNVTTEAGSAKSKGNVQCGCMKKLQVAYCGCKPIQVNTIIDEYCNTLSNHSIVFARWQHHLFSLLNVPSNFQEDVVNSNIQLSPS